MERLSLYVTTHACTNRSADKRMQPPSTLGIHLIKMITSKQRKQSAKYSSITQPRLTFVTVGDGSEKKWDRRTKRAGSIDVFYNNSNMLQKTSHAIHVLPDTTKPRLHADKASRSSKITNDVTRTAWNSQQYHPEHTLTSHQDGTVPCTIHRLSHTHSKEEIKYIEQERGTKSRYAP